MAQLAVGPATHESARGSVQLDLAAWRESEHWLHTASKTSQAKHFSSRMLRRGRTATVTQRVLVESSCTTQSVRPPPHMLDTTIDPQENLVLEFVFTELQHPEATRWFKNESLVSLRLSPSLCLQKPFLIRHQAPKQRKQSLRCPSFQKDSIWRTICETSDILSLPNTCNTWLKVIHLHLKWSNSITVINDGGSLAAGLYIKLPRC